MSIVAVLAFVVGILVLVVLGLFTVKWVLILAGVLLVVGLLFGHRGGWSVRRGGPPPPA